MRAVWSVAAALVFAVSAAAGEYVPFTLQNGLCTVTAPAGWHLEEGVDYQAAVFSDRPGSPCRLVFAVPNPLLNANQLASMELVALGKAMGGWNLVEAVQGQFKGRTRMRVHFSAPLGDTALEGMLYLLYVGDYVVMATASGPAAQFGPFIAEAEKIMESYAVNEKVMRERDAALRLICQQFYDDTVRELLAPNASEEALRQYVVEDHIIDQLKSEN